MSRTEEKKQIQELTEKFESMTALISEMSTQMEKLQDEIIF